VSVVTASVGCSWTTSDEASTRFRPHLSAIFSLMNPGSLRVCYDHRPFALPVWQTIPVGYDQRIR